MPYVFINVYLKDQSLIKNQTSILSVSLLIQSQNYFCFCDIYFANKIREMSHDL